jgi:alkylhydroperoxidase family enzyme
VGQRRASFWLPNRRSSVAGAARLRQHASKVKSTTASAKGAHNNSSSENPPMSKPRISYVDPATVKDPAMVAEFERCALEGTPRPESQAIRAHVPATFWSFANTWRDVFKNGVADHNIKELCRIYVSRSVLCEFCGNQRSIKAAKSGLKEGDYSDLINFESSTRYDERQKAALAYAEAITWDLPAGDELWARLHKYFSEPELVEIGYFVAITMGQQRWLRTLNIEHHQILAGTDGSMAPGFETAEALAHSKQAADYWAKINAKPSTQAAE